MTNLPTAQTNVQLYNCADETAQDSIINTNPEFFNTSPNKLFDMLADLDMKCLISVWIKSHDAPDLVFIKSLKAIMKPFKII